VTTGTGAGVGADVDVEFLELCGRVLLHPASRNTTKAGNLDLMIVWRTLGSVDFFPR